MREKFDNLGKELAEVGIGAGLMVAGPDLAKNVFEQTTNVAGAKLDFLPDNESLRHLAEAGFDTAQSLTGISALAMILYFGAKKLLSPLSSRPEKK